MSTAEEIYRTLTAAQERWAYSFLAASGGAITYALTQTEGQPAALWMTGTGLAVIAWAASFYTGSHYLLHRSAILGLNFQRQKIVDGQEGRLAGQPQSVVTEAVKLIDEKAAARLKRSSLAGHLQFRLFFVGALFYLAGFVLRIWTKA